MVKNKKVMLRTFLWPGWGHLVLGKRKKGWFLWWASLIALLIIAQGITMWLMQQYVPPPGKEVKISNTGVIEESTAEEENNQPQNSFSKLILPLSVTVIGLGLITWVGIYAYKDTKRMLS